MDLTQAIYFLSQIPNIHCGGCLVSAYAFQQFSIKIKERVPNIVSLHNSYEWDDYNVNSAFASGTNKGEARSASHFGWTFDGDESLDADGVIRPLKFDKKVILPVERSTEFYQYAMKYGSWNWMFDRSNISKIELELGVNLSF